MGSEDLNPHAAALAGRCVAAGQQVFTSRGAVAVEVLAKGSSFDAICYDPRPSATSPSRRGRARRPQAGGPAAYRQGQLRADFRPAVVLQDGAIPLGQPNSPRERGLRMRRQAGTGLSGRFGDQGKERIDLAHLAAADCAVANWYPVPSVESLGEAEVFQVEIEAAPATKRPDQWPTSWSGPRARAAESESWSDLSSKHRLPGTGTAAGATEPKSALGRVAQFSFRGENPMKLANKVALITGAGSGMGRRQRCCLPAKAPRSPQSMSTKPAPPKRPAASRARRTGDRAARRRSRKRPM